MTSLRFIVGDEIRTLNAKHAAKHRRCLFTEAGRQQMSNELIDSVTTRGQEDPGQILLDMEQDCLETNADQCFEMFRGPFGVAKWETGGIQNTTSSQVDFDFDVDVEAGLGVDGGDIGPDDTLTQWLLSADTSNVSDSMQPYEPVLNTLGLNTSQLLSSPSPLEIPSSLSLPNEDPKSWFLLSYYRDYIMRLISPLQHHSHTTSDPWNSLVMPCAMATMAELTLGANANHAPLALLNALLATSAFHLHASLSRGSAASAVAREWMVSGKEYTARARGYLAACLVEHARSAGQKKSKYKEILMAVLSLGDAFMVKGDADKRLEHLLYAEQFIRAHGFKKPALSRKRRILHHCYAYMRIMAETTRSNISSQTDDTPSRDTDSPEDSENIKDNDRFCTSRWTAVSDKMMIMEKDPDTAKRDLHLEVPGHWTSTLFPELYGIAESFLLLLSQVIRLANERDITIGQDSGGDLGLREFTLRAKALENSIYRLTSSSSNAGPGTGTTTVTVQAMYTALLIFFYRRVHNLDAMLLQRNVLSVQTYLVQIQQENHDSHRSVAMIWPAFVAACEALLPESQGFFAAWFEAMFEKTGLVSISLVKGVCEFIWRRRTECPDGLSWPEVLKKGGRVLCT